LNVDRHNYGISISTYRHNFKPLS